MLICTYVSSAQEERQSISAGTITGQILINGVLDDVEWETAEWRTDFLTTEPVQGAEPTGKTEFAVLAEARHLIIGVRCHYRSGDNLVSFSKLRDARLNNEDHVRILLDPFRDGLSGYVFAVNALGARYDALVANRGESENDDWDAIWNARTSRIEDGWTLEVIIPMQSINFSKDLTEWGINIERRIQVNQETMRWSNARIDQWFILPSKSGLLTGIPEFSYGIGLNIRPSLILDVSKHDTGPSRFTIEPSLDIGQRIGPNIQATLTVNTDFAETEVDTRQTNLDRFPLFFPEKRAFFLEGADIFEFGIGTNEIVMPFFSRRIGLYDGEQIPVNVGGKINGRIGETGFGALVMNTSDHDGEGFELPNSTMSVVRMRRRVLTSSSVGLIGTFGAPDGNQSFTGGLDFTYQTATFNGNKNFIAGVWGLVSDNKIQRSRDYSAGLKIDYPNDRWDISFTLFRIGDAFDPALGFVPRRGVYYLRPAATFAPRPAWNWVRQMRHQFFPTIYLDLDGKWQTYRVFTAPVNWRLESGDRFEFNWMPRGERITEPFEISDGVVIPEGEYHFTRWRFEGELAAKRRFNGVGRWWFGTFYEGTLHEIELEVNYSPSAFFRFEFAGRQNIARLPYGNFDQTLIGVRVRLNVTPDLQINTFPQYDTNTREFGLNARIHWIYKQQGDLFFVYNHNTLFGEDERAFLSNQFLLKVRYNFRV